MKKFTFAFSLFVLITLLGFSCQEEIPPPIPETSPTTPQDTSPDHLPFSNSDGAQDGYLVALGDGFTTAYNISHDAQGNNAEFSYATGTALESVTQYLNNQGADVEAINLAKSLTSAIDVYKYQVPLVSEYNPAYITLLVGITDIEQEATAAEFESMLRKIVLELRNQNPQATIMIATIPNLSINALRVDLPCLEEKNVLDLNFGLFRPEKIDALNKVIKEIALEYNAILVDLSQTLGVNDYNDYDCLHPNISGQQKIARAFIRALQ